MSLCTAAKHSLRQCAPLIRACLIPEMETAKEPPPRIRDEQMRKRWAKGKKKKELFEASDMNQMSPRPACPQAPGAVWDTTPGSWWCKSHSQGSGLRAFVFRESSGKVCYAGIYLTKSNLKMQHVFYSSLTF